MTTPRHRAAAPAVMRPRYKEHIRSVPASLHVLKTLLRLSMFPPSPRYSPLVRRLATRELIMFFGAKSSLRREGGRNMVKLVCIHAMKSLHPCNGQLSCLHPCKRRSATFKYLAPPHVPSQPFSRVAIQLYHVPSSSPPGGLRWRHAKLFSVSI